MQDWKMMDQRNHGVENARLENAGRKCIK